MVDHSSDNEKRDEEERKREREKARESEQKLGIVSDIGNLLRLLFG